MKILLPVMYLNMAYKTKITLENTRNSDFPKNREIRFSSDISPSSAPYTPFFLSSPYLLYKMTLPPLTKVASALNHPATLLATSAAAVSLTANDTTAALSLNDVKLRFLVAFFVINFGSVSWPGRLDGELAQQIAAEKRGTKAPKRSPLAVNGGRTLVAPAPWAFAIWGAIYMLETAGVLYIASLRSPAPALADLLQDTAPYFFLACSAQALWCCSFRSKYVTGSLLARSLSTIYLVSTSASLSKVHALVTAKRASLTRLQFAVMFFGTSLHFGWTAAASLVNINGALAYSEVSLNLQKNVGFASVFVALALAGGVSLGGGGPTVPLVLAWALKAVSDGMKQRLEGARQGNLVGAQTMKALSLTGSAVCLALGACGFFLSSDSGAWSWAWI